MAITRPAQHTQNANGDRPDLLRSRVRIAVPDSKVRTTIKEKAKRGRAWPVAG